jgi:transposase
LIKENFPARIPIETEDSAGSEILENKTLLLDKTTPTLELRKENIAEVHRLRNLGFKHRQIAAKTGLSMRTICRMLKLKAEQISISARGAPPYLNKYKNLIVEQLEHERIDYTKIYKYLKTKGYDRSYSALRYYILKMLPQSNKISSQLENHTMNYLSNNDIIRGIWKDKQFSNEEVSILMRKWKMFDYCREKIRQFRNAVKTRNKEELSAFIKETGEDERNIFYTFSKGLKSDIYAVMNSITYSYNNGLLEGHINKLKVIKRMMYGRAGYDLLGKKVLGN